MNNASVAVIPPPFTSPQPEPEGIVVLGVDPVATSK
jgi:hypothetical protein